MTQYEMKTAGDRQKKREKLLKKQMKQAAKEGISMYDEKSIECVQLPLHSPVCSRAVLREAAAAQLVCVCFLIH